MPKNKVIESDLVAKTLAALKGIDDWKNPYPSSKPTPTEEKKPEEPKK